MYQHHRHAQILSYLAEHEFLSVEEAVKMLDASPATVRRDFSLLEQDKMAKRIRGGLRRANHTALSIKPFDIREVSHSKEKILLARKAVTLLEGGDVIFVDGGTTTFQIAHCLPRIPLRIITNSLRLAMELGEKHFEEPGIEIFLTGGYIYPQSGQLTGPLAKFGLSQYHANWAFFSASGMDEERLYYSNEMVLETAQTMISNADKIVVLADYSKIGTRSMCHLCAWDKVDILITNQSQQNSALLEKIADTGVKVFTVEG